MIITVNFRNKSIFLKLSNIFSVISKAISNACISTRNFLAVYCNPVFRFIFLSLQLVIFWPKHRSCKIVACICLYFNVCLYFPFAVLAFDSLFFSPFGCLSIAQRNSIYFRVAEDIKTEELMTMWQPAGRTKSWSKTRNVNTEIRNHSTNNRVV